MFVVDLGMSPSDYRALTLRERNAIIDRANERNSQHG